LFVALFVNIVNFMTDTLKPKNKNDINLNNNPINQFSQSGLYVKEDDQDWGSSGMNDIQKQPDISQ